MKATKRQKSETGWWAVGPVGPTALPGGQRHSSMSDGAHLTAISPLIYSVHYLFPNVNINIFFYYIIYIYIAIHYIYIIYISFQHSTYQYILVFRF